MIFFSFFLLCEQLHRLEAIIREKIMSGRVLIEWKYRLCSELSRQRYMDPDITRSTHIEIANIFFNQEQDDSDEISSEHNSAGEYLLINHFNFICSILMLTNSIRSTIKISAYQFVLAQDFILSTNLRAKTLTFIHLNNHFFLFHVTI